MKKSIGFLLVIFMLATLVLASCSAAPGFGGSDMGGLGGMLGGGGYADAAPGGDKGGIFDDSFDAPSDAAPEGGAEDDTGTDADGDELTEKPNQVYLPSGMITAGAWNDNENYTAWLELFNQGEGGNGKFFEYGNPTQSWGYNSLNRIKVSVSDGNAVAGASVVATDTYGKVLFKAVTNAEGIAYLFTNEPEGSITVTSGDASATTPFTAEQRDLTVELTASAEKLNVIEIMLVVDVTGSMGDEISFLKAELSDVINRIAANDKDTVIRLAMLFYRDTGDRVPFDYYDFTDVTDGKNLADQQAALNSQYADGGGDYPEAVDEALHLAVNKQWSTDATTKIIFHVLDAPAHSGKAHETILVNATEVAAEKGIRICPIICSGAADVTEYTMRQAAIYTGGTFIFVTDDSGIGGSHHDPNLPNVTVELLNSMMVRLVKLYHTGVYEPPVYWKEDPNLATK